MAQKTPQSEVNVIKDRKYLEKNCHTLYPFRGLNINNAAVLSLGGHFTASLLR